MKTFLACIAGLILLGACGGGGSPSDSPDALPQSGDAASLVDASPTAESLRQTGLWADFDAEVLAPGVRAYQPSFELWSDGATKRRWVYLPEGSQIDTSNMDFWSYPVGTRLWKEFTRDGVRVETRFLYKTGPGLYDWYMMPYVWNEAQTDAVATPNGVQNALGTPHDVPNTSDCGKCHERMPDVVIGFSAILLDHELDGVTLQDLIAEGRLTQPPQGAGPRYFALPGDLTAQRALGYMHTNCGNCHHPLSSVMDNVKVDFHLAVGKLGTVEGTPTYTTTVNVRPELDTGAGIRALIEPGSPAESAVYERMKSRATIMMPPIATQVVDSQGVSWVEAWILSLAP